MHTSWKTRMRTALVSCWILAFLTVPAFGDDRPNVLLFLADNWSWPHAGVLGDQFARTPAFDRLAADGLLLTHAFCPIPSCSPTRACILTGRPGHQLGDAASLWSHFPASLEVFTKQLHDSGYEVGYSGKGWAPGTYDTGGWAENPAGRRFPSFAGFLEQRDSSRPFFFWLGNTDTSINKWKLETADSAPMPDAAMAVPPCLPDVPEVRRSLTAYYDAVSRVDADAQQAITQIDALQLGESTVIFYTSDNGWQMPRGLANCYDTGTRVPLAVRWTGHIAAGTTRDEFIDLTDLAPTVLELAGLPIPDDMTGRSFAELLHGAPSRVVRDCVYLERERHANVRAGNLSYPVRGIRTRDFLYLRNLRPDRWPAGDPKLWFAVGDFGDVDESPAKRWILEHASEPEAAPFFSMSFAKRPAEELYDLHADPHQLRNVSAEDSYAGILADLRQRVDLRMQLTDDPRTDPAFDGWDQTEYLGGPPRQATSRPSGSRPK